MKQLVFSILFCLISLHIAAEPPLQQNVYTQFELQDSFLLRHPSPVSPVPFQSVSSIAEMNYHIGTQTRNIGIITTALGAAAMAAGTYFLVTYTLEYDYSSSSTRIDPDLYIGNILMSLGGAAALGGSITWWYGSLQRLRGLGHLTQIEL